MKRFLTMMMWVMGMVVCAALWAACTPGDFQPAEEEASQEVVGSDLLVEGAPMLSAMDAVDLGITDWASPEIEEMAHAPLPELVTVGSLAQDDDGDGFSERQGDCDDSRADVNPDAPDECDGDGTDNDCDGGLAPGTDPGPVDGAYGGPDVDRDGFGNAAQRFQLCGTTASSGVQVVSRYMRDCDDSSRTVLPYRGVEVAGNGIDDNCDAVMRGVLGRGTADEPAAHGKIACYHDADGDRWGARGPAGFAGFHTGSCPAGTANVGADCDDSLIVVNPGAREWCNGRDDNCDGIADNVTARAERFRDASGSFSTVYYGPCIMARLGFYPW